MGWAGSNFHREEDGDEDLDDTQREQGVGVGGQPAALLREHVHEQQHLRSRFGCPAMLSAAQKTCCAEIFYRDYFWAPGTDSAGNESRGRSRTLKATLPSKYHDSVTILCSMAARATRSAPIRKPRCPATSFVQSRVHDGVGRRGTNEGFVRILLHDPAVHLLPLLGLARQPAALCPVGVNPPRPGRCTPRG